MNEIMVMILFIIGVTVFVIFLDLSTRAKLKMQIKKEWGAFPRDIPKDCEESLYHAYESQKGTKDSVIDDLTWNDLDMYAVFKNLNLTYSSIGSEALYRTLREYSFDHKQLEELESLISYFKENPQKREQVSFQFARLGKKDFNYAEKYIHDTSQNPLNNKYLFIGMGLLPFISFGSIPFLKSVGLLIFVASLIVNVLYYFVKKGELETELNSMSYLVQGITLGVSLSKHDSPVETTLKQYSKPFKSMLKFAFAFRVKSGSEMEMMIEILSSFFLLPFISYNAVFDKVKSHHVEAESLWQILGQLEVSIAVLNLRTLYGDNCCSPTFQDGGVISENVIHPLLTEPVANPINWTKSTLITGSNASGKSTYVRSVAINCLFAQTINTCLATSFRLQEGHILSSMGVKDSVLSGDSYFIAELKSLQRLINQVQKEAFCYCFIDEILKGTNTVERIAASSSVIQWLTQQNQLAFVATHDIELPQILQKECVNVHFDETVTEKDGVTFDYLIKDGIATSRNAIKLIETMHFPKSITDTAFNRAEAFEKNKTWNDSIS